MTGNIFTIIALFISVSITGAGAYNFLKEKNDKESRKVYSIFIIAGFVIFIGLLSRFF